MWLVAGEERLRGRGARQGGDSDEVIRLLRRKRILLSLSGASGLDVHGDGGTVRYAHRRISTQTFDTTVAAVERAARAHGFSVLGSHDMRASLASKGFNIRPLVIVELGHEDGFDELAALLLPIRLNVYDEEGSVIVAALRPTLFREVFPEQDLDEASLRLEETLVCVLDDACGAGSEE